MASAEEIEFEAKRAEAIQILDQLMAKDNKKVNIKDLDSLKVMLQLMVDRMNRTAMTNLEPVHAEEISNAKAYNKIAKSALIDAYIDSFENTRQSVTEQPFNFISLFRDMSQNIKEESKGLLHRLTSPLR